MSIDRSQGNQHNLECDGDGTQNGCHKCQKNCEESRKYDDFGAAILRKKVAEGVEKLTPVVRFGVLSVSLSSENTRVTAIHTERGTLAGKRGSAINSACAPGTKHGHNGIGVLCHEQRQEWGYGIFLPPLRTCSPLKAVVG